MSDAQTILLTVVVVASATAALTLYGRRRMTRTWTGRVERVHETTRRDDRDADGHHVIKVVKITFRTDQGKTVRAELDERAFVKAYPDGLAVGDRVSKAAGAWYPVLEA